MSAKRMYYNSTDTPYTVNGEGQMLGGRERGEFESTPELISLVNTGKFIDRGEVVEDDNSSKDNNSPKVPEPKAASKSKKTRSESQE